MRARQERGTTQKIDKVQFEVVIAEPPVNNENDQKFGMERKKIAKNYNVQAQMGNKETSYDAGIDAEIVKLPPGEVPIVGRVIRGTHVAGPNQQLYQPDVF